MNLLVVVVGLVAICLVLVLMQSGTLTFHVSHMNWLGIILHSLFVGALLYLVVSLVSKNPKVAKDWGLVGMSCIIGWNLLISIGLI